MHEGLYVLFSFYELELHNYVCMCQTIALFVSRHADNPCVVLMGTKRSPISHLLFKSGFNNEKHLKIIGLSPGGTNPSPQTACMLTRHLEVLWKFVLGVFFHDNNHWYQF